MIAGGRPHRPTSRRGVGKRRLHGADGCTAQGPAPWSCVLRTRFVPRRSVCGRPGSLGGSATRPRLSWGDRFPDLQFVLSGRRGRFMRGAGAQLRKQSRAPPSGVGPCGPIRLGRAQPLWGCKMSSTPWRGSSCGRPWPLIRRSGGSMPVLFLPAGALAGAPGHARSGLQERLGCPTGLWGHMSSYQMRPSALPSVGERQRRSLNGQFGRGSPRGKTLAERRDSPSSAPNARDVFERGRRVVGPGKRKRGFDCHFVSTPQRVPRQLCSTPGRRVFRIDRGGVRAVEEKTDGGRGRLLDCGGAFFRYETHTGIELSKRLFAFRLS